MKTNTILLSRLRLHFKEADIIAAILARTKVIRFKKGEVIMRQEDNCDRVGVITKGVARWYHEGGPQENSVIQFFGVGNFLTAPYCFFHGEPAYGSIQALDDLEIYFIVREDFDAIGAEYPAFLTHSYAALSKLMMQYLDEKNQLLRLSATDRYLYFQEKYPEVALRVSLGHISSYLGIRQSSLSRIRRDLSQKGRKTPTFALDN